jgi:hypothetical protein
MKPSELHALVGKVLVPAFPRRSIHTIRWRVVGFGTRDVRLRTVHGGHASSTPIVELELDILSGQLRIEDMPANR